MSYYQTVSNSSDIIDTSSNNTDSSKHRSKKTQKKVGKIEDNLKSIIRVLDNRLINPKDFTVSTTQLKELDEIIESIHAHQCKCKSILKNFNNFCNVKEDHDKVLLKSLKNNLESALHDIDRYSDKIGEILNSIADKYLRRLCRVTKKIESCHCHGFVPLNHVLDNMHFVNRLIELLNGKLLQVGEISDVSTIEPLFGGRCCQNYEKDVKEDPECSDENDNILKQVLKEHMINNRIDLITQHNGKTLNEKYIKRLNNQHIGFMELYRKTNEKLAHIKQIKVGSDDLLEEKEDDGLISYHINNVIIKSKIEYDNLKIKNNAYVAKDVVLKDVIKSTIKSDSYKKIRNNIFTDFMKTETVNNYLKTQFPIVCPCTFFKNERAVEKTMITYIEFFRFGKYIWAYTILKTLAEELIDGTLDCKNVKDFYFLKNQKKHQECLSEKNKNTKYNFINDIFQKYFGEFLHDDRLFEGSDSGGIDGRLQLSDLSHIVFNERAYLGEIDYGEPLNNDIDQKLKDAKNIYNAMVREMLNTILPEYREYIKFVSENIQKQEYIDIYKAKDDNKTKFDVTAQFGVLQALERTQKLKDFTPFFHKNLQDLTDFEGKQIIKDLADLSGVTTHGEDVKSAELLSKITALKTEITEFGDKIQTIINKYLKYEEVYNKLPTPIVAGSFGSLNLDTKRNGLLGFGGILGL